jgi:hypothetical protein
VGAFELNAEPIVKKPGYAMFRVIAPTWVALCVLICVMA